MSISLKHSNFKSPSCCFLGQFEHTNFITIGSWLDFSKVLPKSTLGMRWLAACDSFAVGALCDHQPLLPSSLLAWGWVCVLFLCSSGDLCIHVGSRLCMHVCASPSHSGTHGGSGGIGSGSWFLLEWTAAAHTHTHLLFVHILFFDVCYNYIQIKI